MRLTDLIRLPGSREILQASFQMRPDSEYLIYHGQRLTRRQVFAEIQALAAGLQALGVRKGDRVVSLLPACPEAVYALFLPHLLGSVNVPLNPLLGEYELRHILGNCQPKVILTQERWLGQDFPAMLAHLIADIPTLEAVVVAGSRQGSGCKEHSSGLFKVWPVADTSRVLKSWEAPVEALTSQDVTRILYTSGTTGLPKGAVHTRGRSWSIAVRQSLSRLSLSAMRCLLLPFPPYQYAGQFGLLVALLAGGKVILAERPDPAEILAAIQRERVTQIAGSPTFYRLLFGSPEAGRSDLSSLRRLAFASEPLTFDLARQVYERVNWTHRPGQASSPGCSLENLYGTNEVGVISWTGLHDSWEQAARSVGRPAPGVEVRLVDADRRIISGQGAVDSRQWAVGSEQGHLTGGGELVGEVAVRSSQLMLGYYRDEDLTRQSIDSEGWFFTGDIGAWQPDGSLCLLERKKDLIIRGGQNIYPAEIETYLARHPDIYRAAVVGVPHPLSGEAIWAFVQPRPGRALAACQVLDFCRGQIAPYKIPDQVRLINRLPMSAPGKVQKYRLRQMAADEIADQSQIDYRTTDTHG